MNELLIKQYINRLTHQDIDAFAKQYGLVLKENEIEIIYDCIKNNWRTILYGNPRNVLNELKQELEPITYNKLEQLYIYFKEKLKYYL
ncbi:MAG: DUF2624 family protein [Mollicutes bacterium]|nr:DUF2624 family protein [Mollicutes bacterium]